MLTVTNMLSQPTNESNLQFMRRVGGALSKGSAMSVIQSHGQSRPVKKEERRRDADRSVLRRYLAVLLPLGALMIVS